MRGYQDVLDVTADADATPVGFVWRGRRYRVVQVLDSWREHLPWWRLAVMPQTDVDGGDVSEGMTPGERAGVERRGDEDPGAEGTGVKGTGVKGAGLQNASLERTDALPLRYQSEQRVWRVEAAAGRLSATGVFELAHRADAWCLRRLSD